ncbi:conserved hypothetical protein [Ricinus communis]|uniref:Uncharacterized protein n=1 Tax=Ricinus communis TaxID=3988 RepID=B9TBI2_RICCO|nr:conserved hypothetical protein [Ricinus communis]
MKTWPHIVPSGSRRSRCGPWSKAVGGRCKMGVDSLFSSMATMQQGIILVMKWPDRRGDRRKTHPFLNEALSPECAPDSDSAYPLRAHRQLKGWHSMHERFYVYRVFEVAVQVASATGADSGGQAIADALIGS